jgi:LuxR family transcriptional regulator, maltose regulon positive regulatory protein
VGRDQIAYQVFGQGPPDLVMTTASIGGIDVAAHRRDRTAARGVPLGYLGRLLRALEQEAAPGVSSARGRGVGVPGLVEALSERELEVLRLLAAGKPNREIAGELYVAVDTVKKHVTHIFEKLGAANRTQATARARELGLLAGAAEPPTTTRP